MQAGCRLQLQISEFFDHFFQKMKFTGKVAATILGISDKKWAEKINQIKREKRKEKKFRKMNWTNLSRRVKYNIEYFLLS